MKFRLAPVFSDNMILQRNVEVVIWGDAEENSVIKGEICGNIAECEAENGNFKLIFNELEMGGPFELKVSSGDENIVVKNILIGDVWVAGGQSNMEYFLKDSIGGQEEILNSNYPEIRYYNVPRIEYEDGEKKIPEIDDEGWKVSSPETSEYFSAVAYHFAKNIYQNLKIPIGIIGCNKGGTSASCWMSREYLKEDEELKKEYLDDYNEVIENRTGEEEDRLTKEFYKSQEEYTKKEEKYKKQYPDRTLLQLHEDIGHIPWPPPIGRKSYLRPCGLYDTMLKKITSYKIKGVIWYQGEEDSAKPKLYKKLFSNLIKNWRADFNNSELPFLFVQLPMFNDGKLDSWQIIRDAQLYTFKNIDHTSMIVSVDCGDKEDVHPKDKKPIGERLALVAREDVYNENIQGHSPIYKGFEIVGEKIIISFDYVKSGDLLLQDEANPKGFEVCGKDEKFYDARAQIAEDKICVWSEKVKKPVAARYGWSNYMEVDLFNKQGLPASPFNAQNK